MQRGSLQPGAGHSRAGCHTIGQSPRGREWGAGHRGVGGMQAYAGCLPHMLEEALGRDEELEQAAEPISLVAGLQQPKHLAQDRGSRGFEGGVEGLEGTLHRRVQRPNVLREESGAGGESSPATGCCHPPWSLCPPSHTAPPHRASARSLVCPRWQCRRARGGPNLPGLATGEDPGVEHTKHRAAGGQEYGRVWFPALGCGLRS